MLVHQPLGQRAEGSPEDLLVPLRQLTAHGRRPLAAEDHGQVVEAGPEASGSRELPSQRGSCTGSSCPR